MHFELWPQFSDFARFLCAFALKNTRSETIVVIHDMKCCNTTVRKTLIVHHAKFKKQPKTQTLFVAKKGGNVFPI